MQLLCASVALLGFTAQLATTETIIGYDGKEHHWHAHRDGLHDHALRDLGHHRRHDLSHPRLRRWDGHHVPHMLNQAPIIVNQRSLHIATNSHHIQRLGFGVATSPDTLTASAGNATLESATSLNRIEKKNTVDSASRHSAEEAKHAAKRDQNFRFRQGHAQTEQRAAEDLTAEEVVRERERKMRLRAGKFSGGAPSGAPAPAPSPAASPATAVVVAKDQAADETRNMFSMEEELGAPDQGFTGDVVQHDNMKTMTKDWRGEYGPEADGITSYVKICQLYPDNQWCRDRGYHRSTPAPKSLAVPSSAVALWALVVAVSSGFLFH